MSCEEKKPEEETPARDGAPDSPPIELLEKVMADMLDGKNVGPGDWDYMLRDFRKALGAAAKDDIWGVVDVAFGNIVTTSVEMLTRSQIALRMRMCRTEKQMGAHEFPNIPEDAARVERAARFLLEAAERYAKVRHVTHLARRRDDPKVIYFDEAQDKAAATGKTGKGASQKSAAERKA